jgi:exodeoxyribonuclease VII small subunit
MKDEKTGQTFEAAFTELERIVTQLEDGRTTLDEALSAYEKGVALLKHCHRLLTEAEQKVSALTGCDEEGNPLLAELETDS